MTTSITIKDSTGTDRTFNVIRQPGGNVSAILHNIVEGAGMNRTAYPKIELSSAMSGGRVRPVATVSVPYGSVVNGVFVKQDQVTQVIRSEQPPAAPDLARLDAEAYGRQLLSNPQVQALFANGLIS